MKRLIALLLLIVSFNVFAGTLYWLGTADTVAQVATGSIDSVDGTPANNTFTVTIGGVAVSAVGDTDVNTTATNLRTALNASTHPYFAAITWSGGTGNIIGTADTAGAPFIAALTETGAGTGAVTDFAATTASAGPNDWSTADNWDTGSVPVGADDVIIENSDVNIVWGLAQSAVDLGTLRIDQSFTGKIGLDRTNFATSVEGDTVSTTQKDEYREDYLDIGWATGDIGQNFGPGQPNGSTRLKLDNDKAAASVTTIHNTASSSAETGLPAIRLLAAHANANIIVRDAPGGVGVAVDVPGETSTVGIVSVSNGSVFIGSGTTITTLEVQNGTVLLQAAATVTAINVDGGTVTTEGDYVITALNITGGTVNCNNIKTAGNAITTATITGGTLNGGDSMETRTWATVNPDGGSIVADDGFITITTLDEPAGPYTISVD